jgi:hypothetical protein
MARCSNSRILLAAGSFLLAAGLVSPGAPRAASVTGVCPDGSIFIVPRSELIPCGKAKLVDANEVPPLKPQYLPRPYGWEVFNRRNDPNNPYNLVPGDPVGTPLRLTLPSVSAPPPDSIERTVPSANPVAETRVARREPFAEPDFSPGIDLGLTDAELRDLALIVDLMQERAPAAIVSRESEGRVKLARSAAFEQRVRERFAVAGRGAEAVLLFTAAGLANDTGRANLTFVQGHLAYHPAADDPYEIGVLRGGEQALGYVVLPARLDPSSPMDIYWDDRQITATLTPVSP